MYRYIHQMGNEQSNDSEKSEIKSTGTNPDQEEVNTRSNK